MKSKKTILLKKELLQFATGGGKKSNGKNKGNTAFTTVIVTLILLGVFGVLFYRLGNMLCSGLNSIGFGWLYFTLGGIVSLCIGIFGSVFATQNALYKSKDNEILLSLPIKPGDILVSRLVMVFLMSFAFGNVVYVPVFLASLKCMTVTTTMVVGNVLMILFLPLLATSISCLLGWLIGLITSRLSDKVKSAITVLFSLLFMAAYFLIFRQSAELIQKLVKNSSQLGTSIEGNAYPIYAFGKAMTGEDTMGLIYWLVSILVLFLIVFFVLSKTFITIVTKKTGAVKVEYKEKMIVANNQSKALFKKELRRFTSCPIYMLNSAMGSVLMVIFGVAMLIKGPQMLESILSSENMTEDFFNRIINEYAPLLIAGIMGIFGGLNIISAPSVSLEGNAFWLIKSLPIDAKKWLGAKLKLHLLLTIIPEIIVLICLEFVYKMQWYMILLISVFVIAYSVMMASLGLVFGMKFANFGWRNETQAVKSGTYVLLSMLVGMGSIVILAATYIILALKVYFIPPIYLLVFMAFVSVILAVIFTSSLFKNAEKRVRAL